MTDRSRIVRPNPWDNREYRLQSDLARLLAIYEKMHPEDFEGPDTLRNLEARVRRLQALRELDRPMYADFENRVRHPLVRLWRDWRAKSHGLYTD